MHVGIFYLEHVKVLWGHSFGALFYKLGRDSKTAHYRVKERKIWISGVYGECMLAFLTLSRSFEVMHCKHLNQSTEAYGPLVFLLFLAHEDHWEENSRKV